MPRERPEVLSFRAERDLALQARLRATRQLESRSMSEYLRKLVRRDLGLDTDEDVR